MSPTGTEVRLRPATAADRGLLFDVYASTRAEELAAVPWDEATKRAFLTQQFDAQDAHYRTHYPRTTYEVIEVGGEAAGRLYLDRGERDVLIVDIALLPAFRGRGTGGSILREILEEAESQGKRVSIHVEVQNPAHSLYERLGFTRVEERGVYVLLEWTPPGVS